LSAFVSGNAGRAFLDKVQLRHDSSPLTIAPHSGILTSCSMYLKEHFIVLNQGEGNFGIHTSAVLLDPIKDVRHECHARDLQHRRPTDRESRGVGRNFPRPRVQRSGIQDGSRKNASGSFTTATELYKSLDENPPRDNLEARPKTKITFKGQSATMENQSLSWKAGDDLKKFSAVQRTQRPSDDDPGARRRAARGRHPHPRLLPDLLEHIELVTRIGDVKLKRIIFRKASRTHGYFLSSNAHARLDMFDAIGLQCYWHDDLTKDLYLPHLQEGARLLRPRGRSPANFRNRPSSRFYGSAVGLEAADTARISGLVDKLTGFFGHNLGVLTVAAAA